jgi:hypothetical protein
MATAILNPTVIAYVDQANPNTAMGIGTAFGEANWFIVIGIDGNDILGNHTPSNGFCRSLIKYDVAGGLPAGVVIDSARLQKSAFVSGDVNYDNHVLDVRIAPATFTAGVTWNTQPTVTSSVDAQIDTEAAQTCAIDVDYTAAVASAYAGSGLFAVQLIYDGDLTGSGGILGASYFHAASPASPPTLTIDYHTAPVGGFAHSYATII